MSSIAIELYQLFLAEFLNLDSINADNLKADEKAFVEHIRLQLWNAFPVSFLHCISIFASALIVPVVC